MSTFSPKRPGSRAKTASQDRYSPSGPNVTFTRSPAELPGTAVYGVQEIPVKRPLKTQFEKAKTELNVKASVRRPSIKMSVKPPTDTRRNPIAMDPKIPPSGPKKDIPTFRTSAENPLAHQQPKSTQNDNSLRSSSRFAARLKFEADHSKTTLPDIDKKKIKERSIINIHPHGAPQGLIYHTRPAGLTLPGLGFGGSPSCRS